MGIFPIRIKIFFFVLLLMLTISCDKNENPIPVVRFNVTIDLNLPDYNKDNFTLTRVGTQKVGVSGVLIKRGIGSDGSVQFFAFERYCPHDQSLTCSVAFDDDFATATCSCCESQFLVATQDGDIINGPSKYPLKTYQTRLVNNLLTIYN